MKVLITNCQSFFAMCIFFLTTPISNDCLFGCSVLLLVVYFGIWFYCELASFYGFLLCVSICYEWSSVRVMHTSAFIFICYL